MSAQAEVSGGMMGAILGREGGVPRASHARPLPYGFGFAVIRGEREPRRWRKLGRPAVVTLRDLCDRSRRLAGRGDEIVAGGERYRLVSQTTTTYIPWADYHSSEDV